MCTPVKEMWIIMSAKRERSTTDEVKKMIDETFVEVGDIYCKFYIPPI